MICVALGWPDDSSPANAVVSNRKSVDKATVFVGFDTWASAAPFGLRRAPRPPQ